MVTPDSTRTEPTGARIEEGAVIYPNCTIGEGSIIGANAVLRPYTRIGRNSIFGTLSCSEGHNDIGNYTTIHAQCHITSGVHIGDNVFIAPFFIASNTINITEGKHGTKPDSGPMITPTDIEDNVRIGTSVRMIPGLKIGHHALIMQDTLLTHDVEPYAIVKGGRDKVGRVIGFVK
jgi:acetyltransferase-like isoleucine patch superfamily enzyme